jgi:prepilin-type N-terminal cleavage/methylation domain-containing protein
MNLKLIQRQKKATRKPWGFTLIELIVSMAVFLVIAGAALTLFNQHANLYSDQAGTVALNITLRNALAQIQTDAVQAGNGFFGALSTANTPVGLTITNNNTPYDSMYIIQAANNAALLDPGTACPQYTNLGSMTLASGATAAQFPAGAQVLFMNGNGNQMTVAKLTGSTLNGNGTLRITFGATASNGTNTSGGTNDPFGLTWVLPAATDPDQLTDQFCASNGDYVVPLNWVQYSVNGTNQLVRTTSASNDIIADQIIGFKIGAATYQSGGGSTSTPAYSFSAANAPGATPPGYSSKFTLIRSIRVSLIGRTSPTQFTGSNFRNSFDGGNYKIESLSLVINPRNLSMND